MSKIQKILLIIACVLVLVAFAMLIKTAREYKIAQDEYTDLTQYTIKVDASGLSQPSADNNSEIPTSDIVAEYEEPEICPRNNNREDYPDMEIDFEGLKAINPEVVAWLYVDSIDISYPVVQRPNDHENSYYLHHTLEDKENSSGCIFMDWEVDPALKSWNTFIYGHNMKNGTMFGSLKKLLYDHTLYDEHPYIYVYREEGIYRYKIYSYYLDTPDTKMYWTCDTWKEYRAYVRTAIEKSVYDCRTEATADKNSVTLVTCSGSGAGKKRCFVHGTIVDRFLYE